jgi:spore maturation protein CgeD
MLRKAVESVLNQTFQDFELIIIDDNSSDPQQLAYLDEINPDPRVYVCQTQVKEEDRFKTVRYATNVNIGLKLAIGEYITYLCDDDYYLPERLERMMRFLDENSDKHVVFGNQRTVYLKPDGTEEEGAVREHKQPLDNADCMVDHSSVMHRRECYLKVGGWDDAPEHWGHADGLYWKKLGEAGFTFYPLGEVTDVHVYHEGSWTKYVGEMAQA